jgi:hypothetical protein
MDKGISGIIQAFPVLLYESAAKEVNSENRVF